MLNGYKYVSVNKLPASIKQLGPSLYPFPWLCFSAWPVFPIIASICSRPMDRRTGYSVTHNLTSSSGESCHCEALASARPPALPLQYFAPAEIRMVTKTGITDPVYIHIPQGYNPITCRITEYSPGFHFYQSGHARVLARPSIPIPSFLSAIRGFSTVVAGFILRV